MQSKRSLHLFRLNGSAKKVPGCCSPPRRFTTEGDPLPESHSYRVLGSDDGENAYWRLPHLQRGPLFDPLSLNRSISFAAKSASLELGSQLHALAVKLGVGSNVYVSTALVDMYGKCGRMSEARHLFDEMGERNIVTYNSLISGYRNAGYLAEAVALFRQLLRSSIHPTVHGVSDVLVGCAQLGEPALGRQVHCLGLTHGFSGNVVFGTSLVDMYGKCLSVLDSRSVFDRMTTKNVIAWTSMITVYANIHRAVESMALFKEMLRLGFKPNSVTFNSLLSSFHGPEYLELGKQVHCRVILEGWESNEFIAVTLLTAYSECRGSLVDFENACSNLYIWDQITWNAVISGYAILDRGPKAVRCFRDMRSLGIESDFFTYISTLKAAASFCGLEEGKQLHALVLKSDAASVVHVLNGLLSMYAKCGSIEDSKSVFSSMEIPDLISWNALLTACAHHGFAKDATEIFEQMKGSETKPNGTTFLAVLTACSHAGIVEKGLEYFDMMRNDNLLEPPKAEHYAIMVDLLGRAGHLAEAEALIDRMPIDPVESVYKSLLSSCRIHGNKEVAMRAARKLLELYPDDPATYVLLSNVFLTEYEWGDAEEVRALMRDRGIEKVPGKSRAMLESGSISIL
ncbi:hypothetical protein MLD38_008365 [Melastoma candidum]|uniref:Uncharacterized protein n=1 Tax=Melastoma candidum TaxID=119954 RepID=A0ACB9RTS1_9MYRT|nr:hypothetical protein MLD38_008365 [Melastoma candidum]